MNNKTNNPPEEKPKPKGGLSALFAAEDAKKTKLTTINVKKPNTNPVVQIPNTNPSNINTNKNQNLNKEKNEEKKIEEIKQNSSSNSKQCKTRN